MYEYYLYGNVNERFDILLTNIWNIIAFEYRWPQFNSSVYRNSSICYLTNGQRVHDVNFTFWKKTDTKLFLN